MIKIYLGISKPLVLVFFVLFLSSCRTENSTSNEIQEKSNKTENIKTHTPETLQKVIADLEKDLANPAAANHDAMAKQLVEFYASYVKLFPKDSLAPEMLFRAGNQSVNLNDFTGALTYYAKVENKYVAYVKRPECIYLQGFIYDTYLNEFGKAKEKYESLIEQYPKHELAKQSQYSVQNLGMTEQELIKSFEAKNKQ